MEDSIVVHPIRDNRVSVELQRLYSIILKESFEIYSVDVSEQYHKSIGTVQRVSVGVSGFHDNDPYDLKFYSFAWLTNGTGKNFDTFHMFDNVKRQIEKQCIVPEKLLMTKDMFNDVCDAAQEKDKDE